MKKENSEEKVHEVVIITDEQLQVFPQETQETIIFLSENIAPNQLMVLNPFVEKLIEVRKLKDLKYDDSTAEKKKESIEEFKNAKSKVAEFKKYVTETKTKLKQPIDKVGKEILVIEKFGLSEVVDVLTEMEKTFADYLAEEQEKKDIAAKKKLEKANAAIEEVKKLADEGARTIAINEVKTMIQYTFLDEIETEVVSATSSWGIEPLKVLKAKLDKVTLGEYIEKHKLNIDLLEEETFDFLIENFNTKLTAKIQVVQDKITLLESQESHKVRDIKDEVKNEMQSAAQSANMHIENVSNLEVSKSPIHTIENDTPTWGRVVPRSDFDNLEKEEEQGEPLSVETHGVEAIYNAVLKAVADANKIAWNVIQEMNSLGYDFNAPRESIDSKALAIFDAGTLLKKTINHISNK